MHCGSCRRGREPLSWARTHACAHSLYSRRHCGRRRARRFARFFSACAGTLGLVVCDRGLHILRCRALGHFAAVPPPLPAAGCPAQANTRFEYSPAALCRRRKRFIDGGLLCSLRRGGSGKRSFGRSSVRRRHGIRSRSCFDTARSDSLREPYRAVASKRRSTRGTADRTGRHLFRMRRFFWIISVTVSSLLRRFMLVAVAVTVAAPFLRMPLRTALLARGDGALAVGEQRAAWRFYQRAEEVGGSALALHRIVTLAILSNDPTIVREALRSLAHLKKAKAVAKLLFDRALLEWRLRQSGAAESDARESARLSPSVSALIFAGILARRRGALRVAFRDFGHAHRLSPHDPRPLFQLQKGKR